MENNNQNIPERSVLGVINFVKQLNSQNKAQALMELDTPLQSLDYDREGVQIVAICISISLVLGLRNVKIPLPHSYVGALNSFLIRTSLISTIETQL